MKNPKVINEIKPGATYEIPTFRVTEDGLVDGEGTTLYFCKGDKTNEKAFRQEGVFTETLVYVAKRYLETVNVGELATHETSMAIDKLEEALMWINKRAEDRKLREVQGTYKK